MRTLLSLALLLPITCGGIEPDGVWQEKTPIVNSAFLATYQFDADTFLYSVNEYDGLNPIRSFGGTYRLCNDSIELKIRYVNRIQYTDINIDTFLPANNHWSVEGKLVTDTLPTPQNFVLPIRMECKTLVLDDIPFYLITDEQQ